MSKFVRSSKFRHVFGTAEKPENCYGNVKLTKSPWDSNYLAVNPKFVAVCWAVGGGGAAAVLPLGSTGKLSEVCLISGHKGPVLDVAWSPFNDNILATASEDCTVKIWQIPEEPKGEYTDPAQVLSGHGRKAGSVTFHPSANNILATSGLDYKIKIWDIETGDEKFNIDGHAGIIQSVEWNQDGSLLTTFSKDKKLRVLDPRQQSVVAEVEAHPGVKGGRSTFLGSKEKIFSVGFSRTSERCFAIWDPKKLDQPLVDQSIDNASGIIMPFYDDASSVLFLAGKGDGNIRYYELVDDNKLIYFLSQYSSTAPQSGMACMPKRGVNVNTNEIMRLYKAHPTQIEPISFTVPRKSDIFQDDLFPDCPSNEPALSAAEWVGGSNSLPKTRSMAPGFVEKAPSEKPVAFTKKEEKPQLTEAELREENEKLKKRVAFLEAEITKKDAQIKELESK